MSIESDIPEIPAAIRTLVAAIFGVPITGAGIWWLFRLWRSVVAERKEIVQTSAESFLLTEMRTEITRGKSEMKEVKEEMEREIAVMREEINVSKFRFRESQEYAMEIFGDVCKLEAKFHLATEKDLDNIKEKLKKLVKGFQ